MPSPTITLVTVSPNPAVIGQSVTVTATVIPLGAGSLTPATVTFTLAGGTPASQTVSLTGTTASATFTGLGVGAHTATATYDGNADFTASTGFNAVVVVQGATNTTVDSEPDPSGPGQTVTVTATVSPVSPAMGTPTGSVTFIVSGAGGGAFPQPLVNGVATLPISTLGVGSHTITALYSGDVDFLPSAGFDAQTVNPTPVATTTTLTSSQNPSVFGQPVTFTATVAPNPPGTGTPTGSVVFTIDGTPSGPVALVNGVATFTPGTLAVGPRTVSAAYTSDSPDFADSSTTTALTQTVNQASTEITGTVSQSAPGQPIALILIAFVEPVPPGSGTPKGRVGFTLSRSGGGPMLSGSALLDANGFAVLNLNQSVPPGLYTLTSTYSGENNFSASSDSRDVRLAK